jgi:prepilin-type N-terminal cleavage/methylation domain-containing protein
MKKIIGFNYNRGFSLIELLLVILVAGMVLVTLTNLTPVFNLLQNSSRENIARQIVSKRIEDIRTQGYDNLANGTNTFTDTRLTQLPQANAATTIEDCPTDICIHSEPIKKVTIQVDWVENDKSQSFSITTLVSKGGIR